MVRAVISYFWHKDKVICAVLPSHFKPSLDVFSSQVCVCVCAVFLLPAANENGVGVNLCARWSAVPHGVSLSWMQQFPFIYFINTLSPVASTRLKNTQTPMNTNTHARSILFFCFFFFFFVSSCWLLSHKHTLPESCCTSSYWRKLLCLAASDFCPSLQVYHQLLVVREDKKKDPFSLSPWQPLSSSSLFFFAINQTATV